MTICNRKSKAFLGELNVAVFSYFVEKILLPFDKFDNPENSIIRNFSGEPKQPCYRDTTVVRISTVWKLC